MFRVSLSQALVLKTTPISQNLQKLISALFRWILNPEKILSKKNSSNKPLFDLTYNYFKDTFFPLSITDNLRSS